MEVPQALMKSATDVATVPVHANGGAPVLVRDVADVKEGTMPGQVDRYNQRRVVSMTANIQGSDLGDVAAEVSRALQAAGEPPQGVNVDVRGQVARFRDLFRWLGYGLLASVAVIFLLLTAYFQSFTLALASVGAVPGVLCGVAVMLYVTGTTLNIESFMGTIMCIGVSVSNSVMLVTFIDKEWREGKAVPEAARSGAQDRLRPVLMTACAMTIGMVPMALALEHGSEMEAPLGRAVIGGLVVSTFVTLFIVPSVFALLMGHRTPHSPSLHPDDPDSAHYDPDSREPESGTH